MSLTRIQLKRRLNLGMLQPEMAAIFDQARLCRVADQGFIFRHLLLRKYRLILLLFRQLKIMD